MSSESSPYRIAVTCRHQTLDVAEGVLRRAAETTLSEEGIASAEISLVLTDDAEIHRINRQFLDHDYPTDVISFRLDDSPESRESMEGEVIISLDTARRAAGQGWSLESEVVLYVVHGLLHLCGYDDLTDLTRPIMRRREGEILRRLSLSLGGAPAAVDGPEILA